MVRILLYYVSRVACHCAYRVITRVTLPIARLREETRKFADFDMRETERRTSHGIILALHFL